MLKFTIHVDEEFKENLKNKLQGKTIDPSLVDGLATYLTDNARIMERLVEGFHMWVGSQKTEQLHEAAFIRSILKMMDLFRETIDRWDGIAEEYLYNIDSMGESATEQAQPWQLENLDSQYEGITGVYQALLNMGLSQDFIDRYYVDGTLMEIHDQCTEIIAALDFLIKTKKPGFNDLRDGILMLETRFRRLYNRLFSDRFDDLLGFYQCLEAALKIIEQKRGLTE